MNQNKLLTNMQTQPNFTFLTTKRTMKVKFSIWKLVQSDNESICASDTLCTVQYT